MKPVFPATYSTLCPIALAQLVTTGYEIEDVRCRLLVRGVGDTYLIEASSGRYILRAYRRSHRNLQQIEEETALLLALKQAGISVSYPVTDSSGKVIQTLEAAEGKRHAVLFSYAPGKAVRQLTEQQLRILGREMARFHQVSSTLTLGKARWHFDTETTLFKPLALLEPAFSGDAESYAWLQDTAKRIEQKLWQADTSGFSKGYCHFDFLPKNFHFDGDAITLFDFDFMGYGWLIYDIASFWQHLMLEVYAGRMTQRAADDAYSALLEGYREYRRISNPELVLVPYLSIGFWLFYMGFHTTHDQFYAFIQPGQLSIFTGFLKHLVATYWHKEDTFPSNSHH